MSLAKADPKDSPSNLTELKVGLLLKRVSDCLAEQGIESYVVGGLVRDALLGRDTADIDIAIASDALEVAPRVATALGGRYILLDKANRVGRVVLVDKEVPSTKVQWELDFSTFSGNIEQDLAQRDFTIDAMAIELGQLVKYVHSLPSLTLKKGEPIPHRLPGLIDPFAGWDDLHRGVVRMVTESVFTSDAARLLRAVRLAAELGFSIDKKTETLIGHSAHLIANVPGERVREELLRLLAISADGQFLSYLDELNLLTALFPELNETKGVAQPKEHCWDVFEHSLKTVTAVDFLLREGDWEYASEETLANVPWSAELAQHFVQEVSHGSTRRLLLKLAALLHDISKPQTKTIEAGGRIRFLGHAKEGASRAANILARLRFSGKEIKLVETVIRHHLRPAQMGQDELPTRRAIYRYFRDTAEAGIDTLYLSLADHLATRGPNLDLAEWQEHAQLVDYVLTHHFEPETRPPKLVDGHDLIRLFGMSPGAKIGEILEAVREAQAAGEITTREEALAYIERLRKRQTKRDTDLP